MTVHSADPELRRIAQTGDQSVRPFALACFAVALFWLLFGSFFGQLASLKMHSPDLLGGSAALTFGRIRPVHLNTVIYGWATNAMFGVSLWLMVRLVRAPAAHLGFAWVGLAVWNIGVATGTAGLFIGLTQGMEWLELHPYAADIPMMIGAGGIAVSVLGTLQRRRVRHLYVSVWYTAAAYLWFPFIFFFGNFVSPRGVENAAVNWFYAHNALGLWLTPINLAAIYYLIPKVLGRPIYSYWLSLVGFWSLAFFYSLNGMHHLIGGPLPSWMIATSIVASVMMIVPVLAVAINHHMTMVGRFAALRYSPTLTFVVFGAMAYTGVSLQGTMQSLVEVNRVTHFTHWTIGHAHMGVYAFVTLVIFGSMYYILPRLMNREWPSALLIRAHFWLVLVGIFLYVFGVALGGVLQGLVLAEAERPFAESVAAVRPWLWVRSLAGLLLSAGHVVFAWHFVRMIRSSGATADLPAWHALAPLVVDQETGAVEKPTSL